MRIRIIKDESIYREGETIITTPEIGKLLIKRGIAIKTKDIVSTDTRTK